MSKKKIIGLDIDCVLADSIKMFIPELNKYFNKNKKLEEIDDYQFEKIYDVSVEKMNDFFKYLTSNNLWKKIPVIENAAEFTHKVSEKYKVVIVTSRPGEHMYDITLDWLKENKIYFDDLIFLPENSLDKYKAGLDKGYKFSCFIEDCYELAENITKYDIPVMIFDYPWNRIENEKMIRIYSLDEAYKNILKLIN